MKTLHVQKVLVITSHPGIVPATFSVNKTTGEKKSLKEKKQKMRDWQQNNQRKDDGMKEHQEKNVKML